MEKKLIFLLLVLVGVGCSSKLEEERVVYPQVITEAAPSSLSPDEKVNVLVFELKGLVVSSYEDFLDNLLTGLNSLQFKASATIDEIQAAENAIPEEKEKAIQNLVYLISKIESVKIDHLAQLQKKIEDMKSASSGEILDK